MFRISNVQALILFFLINSPLRSQTFTNGQDADLVLGSTNFTSYSFNAVTAAGLYYPAGVAVDPTTGKLFVSDQNNNRVLRFSSAAAAVNGSFAEAVFGQMNFASSEMGPPTATSLRYPGGLVCDASGNLYVADYANNRVLRYNSASSKSNGAAADGVLGQPDLNSSTPFLTQVGMRGPYGVTVDGSGRLYVADFLQHRILRFDNAASKPNGAPADGVLGQIDFVTSNGTVAQNRMSAPSTVSVTQAGTLFVGDQGNNRVLRFNNAHLKANGANADGVLGQQDFTSNSIALSQNGMNSPAGVAVDAAGRLWVGDYYSGRVLRFDNAASAPNGAPANGVLGKPDFVSNPPETPNQSNMLTPAQLCIDASGTLFVPDYNWHRIVRFNNAAAKANGANADVVLGKSSFSSSSVNAVTASNFFLAWSVAVDPVSGKIFVADRNNNRVLRFASATSITNGAAAEAVLGQPDVSSSEPALTQAGMHEPTDIAFDPSGNLYVADYQNVRVLRFNNAASKSSGANADGVYGQPDFVTLNQGGGQNGLRLPVGVACDASGNLFVADQTNSRVLRFNNAASKPNGANADGVLGQPDFTTYDWSTTQATMHWPCKLVIGNGTLWVADEYNHRVLRFNNAASKSNGAPADGVLGQTDFTSSSQATSQSGFISPEGIAISTSGTLFVGDAGNYRVMRFDNAALKPNGGLADGVLGAADFTTSGSGLNASGTGWVRSLALLEGTPTRLFVVDGNYSRVLRFSWTLLPIHLSHFTATVTSANRVRLSWATASETNNSGFEIQRKRSSDPTFASLPGVFIPGNGTTIQPHTYEFIDSTITLGSWEYRLKQLNFNSSIQYSVSIPVHILTNAGEITKPAVTRLEQNYPNPFNPSTTIEYTLAASAHVMLSIYNQLGEKVADVVDRRQEPGTYEIAFDASKLASGIYLCRLAAGDIVQTKKMLLIK